MQSHDTTEIPTDEELAFDLYSGACNQEDQPEFDGFPILPVESWRLILPMVRAALTPPVTPLEPGERVILPDDPDDERASWVVLLAGEDYLVVQAQAFLDKDEVRQLRDTCDRWLAAQCGENSAKTNGTM